LNLLLAVSCLGQGLHPLDRTLHAKKVPAMGASFSTHTEMALNLLECVWLVLGYPNRDICCQKLLEISAVVKGHI
jgi:hypothetical protein